MPSVPFLPKPSSCAGCPLFGDGLGFVPDELHGAAVTVVAQNPGDHEEWGSKIVAYGARWGRKQTYDTIPYGPAPLIGPTGFLMEREYLPIAGLTRSTVNLCNILKCRTQLYTVDKRTGLKERSNDMPTGKTLAAAVEQCTVAHLRIPESTRLVVAMGAHAWRFFDGPQPVTDWRGFLKP